MPEINDQFQTPPKPPVPPRPPYPQYPPGYRPPSRRRWWIPLVIVVGILGFIGIMFAVVIGMISSAFTFKSEPSEVSENSVLMLDFRNVNEYSKSDFFSEVFGGSGSASFLETLRAIETAKKDKKIKGIYLKPMPSIGFAKADEILEALDDFKKSGKFIYSFIEAGNEASYYMSTSADSIFMPTEGIMELNGYSASRLFLKGFYDMIGVNYHVEQFEDFKSFAEEYNRTNYSDSARHQLKVLINRRHDKFVSRVSSVRKMDRARVNAALSRGLYTADSIMANGFIDGHMTEASVKDFIKKKIFPDADDKELKDEEVEYVSAGEYMASADTGGDEKIDSKKQIAIINGVGGILSGTSSDGLFGSDYEIRSSEFIGYLKEAREDEDIKAIILRIDSPGGSVIASDEIWEEIQKTRKVKPVIASMSDVAASGGYYIAMACDKIVAHPETITGSIGVILAIPNFSGTMNKLDVTMDTVNSSPAANFLNVGMPFTEKDKAQLHTLSKGIYDRFVTRVAASRGKTYDEIRAVAKGRVWSGEDAKRVGLVDELGGIRKAIEIAKKEIGVDPRKKVYTVMYPEKKDPIEELISSLGGGDKKNSRSAEMNSVVKNLADQFKMKPEEFLDAWGGMPESVKSGIRYHVNMMMMSKREKMLVTLPYMIDIQ